MSSKTSQVYEQVLGEPYPNMYDTSAGLLLDNTLHKMFDTLDWSLYLEVNYIARRAL
jgi:hypothetical protein